MGNLAAVITLSLQTLVNVIAIGFDAHLIYFHIWLTKQGITTFQHVTYLRELKDNEYNLKHGAMSQFEFDKWKKQALQSNAPMKKSKTIVKMEATAVAAVVNEDDPEEEQLHTLHVSKDNISQNAGFDKD